LTTVTIGHSVEIIGYNAFRLCHALTSIAIPNSVARIDGGAGSDAAFYDSGLTTVTIANGQTISGITFNSPTGNPPGVSFFGRNVATLSP
jgi:hypothetical protein